MKKKLWRENIVEINCASKISQLLTVFLTTKIYFLTNHNIKFSMKISPWSVKATPSYTFHVSILLLWQQDFSSITCIFRQVFPSFEEFATLNFCSIFWFLNFHPAAFCLKLAKTFFVTFTMFLKYSPFPENNVLYFFTVAD